MGLSKFSETWLPFFIGIYQRAFYQSIGTLPVQESKCESLLCIVDITQVLVGIINTNFTSTKWGVKQQIVEKKVASKICGYLRTFDKEKCVLCLQAVQNGYNECSSCQKEELPILLGKVNSYLTSVKKKMHLIILYDSRNLNPLSRLITSGMRYSKHDFMDEETFVKNVKESPSLHKIFNMEDGKVSPSKDHAKIATGMIKESLGNQDDENDGDNNENDMEVSNDLYNDSKVDIVEQLAIESLESYISQRFSYAVIEQWFISLCNNISKLNNGIVEYSDNVSIAKDKISASCTDHNLIIVVDAIPIRAFLFQEHLLNEFNSEDDWNFSNETFSRIFYRYYVNSLGYTKSLKFKDQLRVNGLSFVERLKQVSSEADSNSNPATPIKIQVSEESNKCFLILGNSDTVYHFYQNEFFSREIGEADIKTLPYIQYFLRRDITPNETRKTIWIDSIDSDSFLSLMLLVNDAHSNIMSPYAFNTSAIYGGDMHGVYNIHKPNTCIILDRGVKDKKGLGVHMDLNALTTALTTSPLTPGEFIKKSEVDIMPDMKGDLPLASKQKKNSKTGQNDILFDYENGDMDKTSKNSSTGKKTLGRGRSNSAVDKQVRKLYQSYAKMVRFIDILDFYKHFVTWISPKNYESFFLYMLLAGSDYTKNLPGIAAGKLLSTFEHYVNGNPPFFGNNKNTPFLKLSSFGKKNIFPHPKELFWSEKQGCCFVIEREEIKRLSILIYAKNLKALHKKDVRSALTSLDPSNNSDSSKNISYETIYERLRENVAKNLEREQSKAMSKSKSMDLSSSEGDTTQKKKLVRKNTQNNGSMVPLNDMIGEFKRACWSINYYLGLEGGTSQTKLGSCDQDAIESTSIWGWRIIPASPMFILDDTMNKEQLKYWMAEKIDFINHVLDLYNTGNLKQHPGCKEDDPQFFEDEEILAIINHLQAYHEDDFEYMEMLKAVIRLLVYIDKFKVAEEKEVPLQWKVVKDNIFI